MSCCIYMNIRNHMRGITTGILAHGLFCSSFLFNTFPITGSTLLIIQLIVLYRIQQEKSELTWQKNLTLIYRKNSAWYIENNAQKVLIKPLQCHMNTCLIWMAYCHDDQTKYWLTINRKKQALTPYLKLLSNTKAP